jgi:hypothetical protein
MSFPFEPDYECHARAVDAAARIAHEVWCDNCGDCFGITEDDRAQADAVLAAYFASLDEQGIKLVVQPPVNRELSGKVCSCGHDLAAHRGDGVCLHCGCETVLIEQPKCKKCEGSGYSTTQGRECPRCGGTGKATMVDLHEAAKWLRHIDRLKEMGHSQNPLWDASFAMLHRFEST